VETRTRSRTQARFLLLSCRVAEIERCLNKTRILLSPAKPADKAAEGDALLDGRYRVVRLLGEQLRARTFCIFGDATATAAKLLKELPLC
jgi:hypothetical protein